MRPEPTQYNSFAAEYADHAKSAPYNALYDRPATLDVVGDVKGQRILDAACGPGLYLEELLGRGATVVACDASPEMVEIARRRVADRASVCAHNCDEPFEWLEAGSIDVALMALAYHYLNDRPTFLREMYRALTPSGSLVISTHHPMSDWLRCGGEYFDEVAITETWSRGWEITTRRLPLTTLCAEFADAGFLIERIVEPLPISEMAVTHPVEFAKLSSEPAFIIFKLRPAPG